MHGNTWVLEVAIEGVVKDNMIIDFHDFKKIVNSSVIDKLDHTSLNEILFYPSCENLSEWIWAQLSGVFNSDIKLKQIKLWESSTSYFIYEGR